MRVDLCLQLAEEILTTVPYRVQEELARVEEQAMDILLVDDDDTPPLCARAIRKA